MSGDSYLGLGPVTDGILLIVSIHCCSLDPLSTLVRPSREITHPPAGEGVPTEAFLFGHFLFTSDHNQGQIANMGLGWYSSSSGRQEVVHRAQSSRISLSLIYTSLVY